MICRQSEGTTTDNEEDEGDDTENAEGTTVFVKNLNFDTTEETLKEVTCIRVQPLILYFLFYLLYSCVVFTGMDRQFYLRDYPFKLFCKILFESILSRIV